MIRSKKRRVAAKYWRYGPVALELAVKKLAHKASAPALGVFKAGVQRKVAVIKSPCCKARGIRGIDGHIENGKIEKINMPAFGRSEVKRALRRQPRLGGRAEQQIHIDADAGLLDCPECMAGISCGQALG